MAGDEAWPMCLGHFDEESCRFFLRELGQRMVQFYPFSVGMEEVFVQIVDEYGFEGAADVLSVLHELLEDDCTASGIGDDGDIWRSWRHAWRHRNDDRHNPYIPRARGRVLPEPTSTRIRLLKATNFVTLQQAQLRAEEYMQHRQSVIALSSIAEAHSIRDLSAVDDTKVSPSVRQHHQVLLDNVSYAGRSRQLGSSPGASSSSSQPSEEHGLLSSAHLRPRFRSSTTGSPRKSMPAPTRKHTFSFDVVSPRRRRNATTSHVMENESAIWTDQGLRTCEPKLVDIGGLVTSTSPAPVETEEALPEIVVKTPLSQRLFRMHEHRYSLPSDVGSTDVEATPHQKRHVHRQARLIDGALFQSKSRKGNVITETLPQQSPAKVTAQNNRSSWHSTQNSPRASWLRNIVTRFRGKQARDNCQPRLRKRHSSLDCGFSTPEADKRDFLMTAAPSASPHLPEMRQVAPAFGLDGAFDDHNVKPLPWSPGDDRPRPSMQSELDRMFASTGSNLHSFDSGGSVSSLGTNRHNDHDDLRSMVSGTMTGPHELSPVGKALRYRFSKTSSSSAPSSPRTFTTFANKNPYRDSKEEPELPTTFTQQHNDTSSTVWPIRDVNGISTPTTFNYNRLAHSDINSSQRSHHLPQHRRAVTAEDGRGRRPATPPTTPFRSHHSRNENSPPKTPRPRSRSPAKKFIGMIKSMSTNQIPTLKTPSPPKLATPSSTSKKRWKDLSHKLKHGFLTADLEQLDQEDLMEQYAANNTRSEVRIVTPPSSHDRMTFPVSIKSSGQSKLWAELEYMLIETCNTFLKDEYEKQRLSRDSVLKTNHQWSERNRPQVIEFYYDQSTQYELLIANLRSIQLYSDYSQDAIMLNSVLHQWKILIRELSVKTLCMPDSIVRRWLHDARRVLELLGAEQDVLMNMDKLTSLCMAVIGSAEKERARKRYEESEGMGEIHIRHEVPPGHRRSVSDGSQRTLHKHELALLRGTEPPPLPTPSSTASSSSRKPTPQELQHLTRRAQERKAVPTPGPFVFSANQSPQNGSTRSRVQPRAPYVDEEQARVYYD